MWLVAIVPLHDLVPVPAGGFISKKVHPRCLALLCQDATHHTDGYITSPMARYVHRMEIESACMHAAVGCYFCTGA